MSGFGRGGGREGGRGEDGGERMERIERGKKEENRGFLPYLGKLKGFCLIEFRSNLEILLMKFN